MESDLFIYEVVKDNKILETTRNQDEAFKASCDLNASVIEKLVVDRCALMDLENYKTLVNLIENGSSPYRIGYDKNGYITHLYLSDKRGNL